MTPSEEETPALVDEEVVRLRAMKTRFEGLAKEFEEAEGNPQMIRHKTLQYAARRIRKEL